MRILIFFLFTLFACIHAQENVKRGCTNYTGTPSLVLWTYSSFMTDPNYIDFTYRFEQHQGLPRGSVVLCRMKSVDLNKHLGGPPPPGYLAPNIIIGLDTILETLNNDSHLIPFETPNLDDMVPIVTTLGHYGHMKPYDWGLTAIWYNESVVLELNRADDNRTFNLQTFLDSGLVSRFVTSDPTRDTAGLAFFMWTVAELGDSTLNKTGKINYPGGWQTWWQKAFQRGLTIVDSWGDAIDMFYDPTKYSDIMSSYGASPAYEWCLANKKETRSIVSWFNQTRFGWAQVEGYVLVNDSKIAREFINYFISPALQDYIALHQFMNPVNKNAKIEQCFIDVAIQPQNVTLYNKFSIIDDIEVITERMISKAWFNEWKQLKDTHYNPHDPSVPITTAAPTTTAPTTTAAPSTAPSTGTSTNTSTSGTSGSNETNGSERMYPIMGLASTIMLIMIAIM